MTARILFWTTERGADLPELCRVLTHLDLHLLVLGELQPGQVELVEDALGMDGYVGAGTEVTPHCNAVFVRPGGPLTVLREHTGEHTRAPRIPMVNVEVGIRDAPGSIVVVGHHACFYGPTLRQIEAEWFSRVIQAHGRVMVFGDFNEPAVGEEPDLTGIRDRAHFHDRTYYVHGIGRVPDHRADEALTTAGYVDLAKRIGTPTALAPTAGYAPGAAGQGGELRIDRAYADPATAEAIANFQVLRGYEDLSDHRPLLLTADLPRLQAAAASGQAQRRAKAAAKQRWREQLRATRLAAEAGPRS
ncbi:endonuclease/exonuclease/phosphatase family protein [Streptomyces sp. FH025]|uniref:endonuclease/exonuclease/phosphatase family protein n=1 Tax=Streptomyces sp. FH025 TaxID=2815937 RepID=UPI001A9CC88E|nr:endonuclease/exonuclease/phosphatase family protein [Streptomyces sp. FH025]MBO1415087.1 endonuclease/exonuclease/phosphatase family protein [Streptomyces sp. FH025]